MGVVTYSLIWIFHLKCHMAWLSMILLCTEWHAYDFVIKYFVIKKEVLFVLDPVHRTVDGLSWMVHRGMRPSKTWLERKAKDFVFHL